MSVGHRADEGLSAAEGVAGEELSSPEVSVLCRECGNGCTIPWLCIGQLFSYGSWERVTQVHQCFDQLGASIGKTSESPGLPGKVQITGMHIA